MNHKTPLNVQFTPFQIHKVKQPVKSRDSPTFSILKTPTAIFVKTRSSTAKTKKLTFANGPVDLQTLRNGSHESDASFDSGVETGNYKRSSSNGDVSFDNVVEVAISPVKTMEVSPETWKAFLEYKKYSDYPNETEKTDYTYSRLSRFRHKEIIPGFLIRPNLSRSSISSRRTSLSYPSSQTSFNESYQSGSYDFKVYNQPRTELIYDYNIPSQTNKFGRSKYYLRSSNFNSKDEGDDNFKSESFEKEYNNQLEEPFVKKTTYVTTEPSSPYYTKLRPLNLDDADIDEVDLDKDQDEQLRRGLSGSNRGEVWSGRNQETSTLKNFFTTVFLYVASVGTLTRDLFSKYVLRRESGWSGSQYQDFGWRKDGSRYMNDSWIPWGGKTGYSTDYSGGYYGRPLNWYQKIFYYVNDKFSHMKNFLWGSSTGYSSYRYGDSSSKRRFWWFFIPLLLLAGLWLYQAEQNTGFLSNQYKQVDCRTNGLLTSLENTIKPIWGSGYVAYKRISASATCYVNDSWERLKLPFLQMSERLSETSFGFLLKIWKGLWGALFLTRDFFSGLSWFVLELASELVTAAGNFIYSLSRNVINGLILVADPLIETLRNFCSFLVGNLRNVKNYLYLLLFAPESDVKHPVPGTGECFRQQKSVDMLKSEFESFKSLSGDLTMIKKKIDELELELRKEKELRKNQNEVYDRQLDENHKTLQKYQTAVNHALFSTKRPHFDGSSVQYLLDNQSDTLKQWITQNFLLKSDSTSLDEEKFSFLLKKFTNRSEEELLALRREFALFVQKHKTDLESLRRNYDEIPSGDVSPTYVNKIVGDAIKRYDADKTGKVDYALETAGGQVVSIRCTETYIERPKSYVLLGWSVWSETSSPRDAINPGVAPGQCWAFVGSQGFLVLQLSHTIRVTGFTMEHISKTLVPRGHIESAPRDFSMWGLKHEYDVDPYFFGEYEYLDNDETLQYFPVTFPTGERFNMVELKITSNHGNPNCTCLYRIRVHGDLQPSSL